MPLATPADLELKTIRALVDFRGQRVLEIGTGDGRLAWPFAPEAASWIALDPDPEELGLAAAELRAQGSPNLHLLVGDGRALGFPAGGFDRVLFTWSLC